MAGGFGSGLRGFGGLLGSLIALAGGAGVAQAAPGYRITLDARTPRIASFVLTLDPTEMRLAAPEAALIGAPAYGAQALARIAPGIWRKPAGCRAGAMLIGAHEGFHVLLGGPSGRRPAWVNESWASYFAIRAARRHLDPAALAVAEALVATPMGGGLLDAERRFAAGEAAAVTAFYSKGARFWAAIEAVLEGTAAPGDRLPRLIRQTRGFAGLDWMDVEAVAAALDRHSNGRAGPIVRCAMADLDCPG